MILNYHNIIIINCKYDKSSLNLHDKRWKVVKSKEAHICTSLSLSIHFFYSKIHYQRPTLTDTNYFEEINLPSKLLTSTGISWKIFFYSIILLGEPPWKKSTRRVKSRSQWFQNQNFDSEVHRVGKKDFPRMSKLPSGLLTSTDTKNVWR